METLRRIRIHFLSPYFLILVCGVGCGPSGQPDSGKTVNAETAKPVVAVSSFVLAEFVRELGDDAIEVRDPDVAGAGPLWKPSHEDIRSLQTADLVFMSGAGYEPWQATITLPGSRTVDTSAGYAERLMPVPQSITHQHGPEGRSANGEMVWATWLDPELATAQLRVVEQRLQGLTPNRESAILQRSNALANALDQLDSRLRALADRTADRKITVLSDGPFYHYLTRRLGWNVIDAAWAPDAEFNAAQTAALEKLVETLKPILYLRRLRRGTQSGDSIIDPLQQRQLPVVEIDLCVTENNGELTLIQRLNANLDRLVEGLALVTD